MPRRLLYLFRTGFERNCMCLILFAYDRHPEYELVLLANRDEFYDRPTKQAGFWDDDPRILAGRDLREGGTWLGVLPTGRLAAVTNVREPGRTIDSAESRGTLVRELLASKRTAASYAEEVGARGSRFNGFNLLVYDGVEFAYVTNRPGPAVRSIESGIHGLSNADLDTAWPKVRSGKRELEDALTPDALSTDRLLAILQDDARAREEDLPDTGVGLDLERVLSSRFIRSPKYGTRSSTVVLIERGGRIVFTEQTHVPNDTRPSIVEFELIPT